MQYHAKIITDLPTLAELESAWRELESFIPENTGFFASWAYTQAYLQHHQQINWCVIAIREGERGPLQAVFPLEIAVIEHEGMQFRCGKPLGVVYLTYIEFFIRSHNRRKILNVLFGDALRNYLQIDFFCLWPLHERSMLYQTLVEDLSGSAVLKAMRFPDNLHEFDARGIDFEVYTRMSSAKTFADARYCERRMRKEGEFSFCHAEVDPEGFLIEQLCQRNAEQFHGGHVYQDRPDWAAYLRALYIALAPQRLAEIATLRLDGHVISSALVFRFKQRRYLYMYAYDTAYARFSPSKVLLANLMGKVADEGGVLCFGAGSHTYKRDWMHSVGEFKAVFVFLNPEARRVLEVQLLPANIFRLFGG